MPQPSPRTDILLSKLQQCIFLVNLFLFLEEQQKALTAELV